MTAPTDQRAGVRPISFLLDDAGNLSDPVTLKIRPEDLVRTEPSRLTVHQTLGRETQGWVDNFGQGLPSLTISGHTGWRASGVNQEDGVAAFEALNYLIAHEYHYAKQDAIDSGLDPAEVKLLFVDMLDGFAWSVAPTQFVLRRNKSRPLLMQYNIALQAVSTSVDYTFSVVPTAGSVQSGEKALTSCIDRFESFLDDIVGMINDAVDFVNGVISGIASVVSRFVGVVVRVMKAVKKVVSALTNGFDSIANSMIGIAKDLAHAGSVVFWTFASIAAIPSVLKARLSDVASAFSELRCIFGNSLRPRSVYENYDGIYGASNCSSTTGGRMPSVYANANVFDLIQPRSSPVQMSSSAISSTQALRISDPVLAPMPIPEIGRHLGNIANGVSV